MKPRKSSKTRAAFSFILMILLDSTLHSATSMPGRRDSPRERHYDQFTESALWSEHGDLITSGQDGTPTAVTVLDETTPEDDSVGKVSHTPDLKERIDNQHQVKRPMTAVTRSDQEPANKRLEPEKEDSQSDRRSSGELNANDHFTESSSCESLTGNERRVAVHGSLSKEDLQQSLHHGTVADSIIFERESVSGPPSIDSGQTVSTTATRSELQQSLRKKRFANLGATSGNISNLMAGLWGGNTGSQLPLFAGSKNNGSSSATDTLLDWFLGRDTIDHGSKLFNDSISNLSFPKNYSDGDVFRQKVNESEEEDAHAGQDPNLLGPSTWATPDTSFESKSHLSLTSRDVIDCMIRDDTLDFFAASGSLVLDSRYFTNMTGNVRKCELKLSVPSGHAAELTFDIEGACSVVLVFVWTWETHANLQRTLFDACSHALPRDWRPPRMKSYSSPNSTLLFSFQAGETNLFFDQETGVSKPSRFSFVMHFSSLKDFHKLLDVNLTTPSNGFIMTKGWDGVTSSIMNMDTWVFLPVPEDKVVMLSMIDSDLPGSWTRCTKGFVGIYTDPTLEQELQVFCGNTISGPTAYKPETGGLYVRFFRDWHYVPEKGFRLYFSFHAVSDQLPQLADGTWNCSVPHWSRLQTHFPCNLRAECAGLEDEAPCPYTTPQCGAGRISIRDRCYIYSFPSKHRKVKSGGLFDRLPLMMEVDATWNKAEDDCRRAGARLASLGSYQERQMVQDVVFKTDNPYVFIGMIPVEVSAPYIYKDMWRHLDGTVAYYTGRMLLGHYTTDSIVLGEVWLHKVQRDAPILASALCEMPNVPSGSSPVSPGADGSVRLAPVNWTSESSAPFVTCPGGHMTHSFLACDLYSDCWVSDVSASGSCSASLAPLPPSFTCRDGLQRVPYTLVCDHHVDCGDRSDERFCVYAACDVSTQFQCFNHECVSLSLTCNEVPDCRDASDEEQCGWIRKERDIDQALPPPALIIFDGRGGVAASALNDSGTGQHDSSARLLRPRLNDSVHHDAINRTVDDGAVSGETPVCPDTHFQCAGHGYCLPVFVRCNQVYDCPDHEDEMACDLYSCPGFYRCRGSRTCLHQSELCDGIYQCPQRDDELLCDFTCPRNCTCYGLAYICPDAFPVAHHPQLRYLDASGSGLSFSDVTSSALLVYLSLARCGITELVPVSLPNLQSLDLSGNLITSITDHHLRLLPNLRHLILAGNPLSAVLAQTLPVPAVLSEVVTLDLTDVHIPELNISNLDIFPHLHTLNLSRCGVVSVFAGGVQSLSELRVVDLRGNPLTFFPKGLFERLDDLHQIFADSYKLCCPAMLPSRFNPANCKAPSNEISSCQALLRSDVYRIFLSIFATLSIAGNLVSLIARVFVKKYYPKMGFDVFVTNLCISDLLMGVYLSIIGVADRQFLGTYLWNDTVWRNSTACKVAGVLCLLSNEVSAIIICLITLDRFLALGFPFSKLHFDRKRAVLACGLTWTAGLVMVSIPLLPRSPQWEFYNQTGICIPLPINRNHFSGQTYAFGIMIVFNFVLFLLIAAGQIFIYWSVKLNQMQSGMSEGNNQRDVMISQRLIVIALSDFLCWFPIGLLGLLASQGIPIASEVNVAIAILVLPINSAIYPFLYTLNVLLERFRLRREQRLQRFLLARMMAVHGASNAVASHSLCNQDEALQVFKRWINKGVLSRETATRYLIGKGCQLPPGKSKDCGRASHVLEALVGCSSLLPGDQGAEGGSPAQQNSSLHATAHLCADCLTQRRPQQQQQPDTDELGREVAGGKLKDEAGDGESVQADVLFN